MSVLEYIMFNQKLEKRQEMKAVKIMLDAGHYGKYNHSMAVQAYYESDFTFRFCSILKYKLEDYGITADVTRSDQQKDLSLEARGRVAETYDLFLSIHSNAVSSGVDNTVDYPVAITMINDNKTTLDEESFAVGEKLVQAVAEVMQTRQAARVYTRKSEEDRNGNGILADEGRKSAETGGSRGRGTGTALWCEDRNSCGRNETAMVQGAAFLGKSGQPDRCIPCV